MWSTQRKPAMSGAMPPYVADAETLLHYDLAQACCIYVLTAKKNVLYRVVSLHLCCLTPTFNNYKTENSFVFKLKQDRVGISSIFQGIYHPSLIDLV